MLQPNWAPWLRKRVTQRIGPGGAMQRAEQADAVRVLETLLAPMSAEKREVFYLAELEGFTAPEIAEALGIRLSTVYSRLRAARAEFEEARARFQEREKGVRS